MAHVYAHACLPGMIKRHEGIFSIPSRPRVLTQPYAAAYAATKHAAVGFAESLLLPTAMTVSK